MNTIQKLGTATSAMLLALLAGACGAEDGTAPEEHIAVAPEAGPASASQSQLGTEGDSAGRHLRRCRMSADAVERWIRAGEPVLSCRVDGNVSEHQYGDDRRQPAR
jgi:hypothetical protein